MAINLSVKIIIFRCGYYAQLYKKQDAIIQLDIILFFEYAISF